MAGSAAGARSTHVAIAALAALILSSPWSHASGDPTPASVLEAFVQTAGGRKAYEALHNRILSGTCSLQGKGIAGTIILTEAEPNKSHLVLTLGNLGTLTQATDGTSAWVIEPLKTPRQKSGAELAEAVRAATFHWFLKAETLYEKSECASDTLDGRLVYKVTMRPALGDPDVVFFDAETHLLVGMNGKSTIRGGKLDVERRYSDYRKVDGVLIPHRMTQAMAGSVLEIVFERVEHNGKIAKDLFDLPAVLQDK